MMNRRKVADFHTCHKSSFLEEKENAYLDYHD
jgi:hypothetical protein